MGREFAPSTGAIALHVDDVATARPELEAHGVEFDGETMDSGVCFQSSFRIPTQTLILHHRYAPPGEMPSV